MRDFVQSVVKVSREELPRVLYAWALRFFLKFGQVLGWTVVIAVTVTRFSIHQLPVILLVQAFFTIVGTLFFSVIVNRFKGVHILLLNISFAVVLLFVAFFYYEHDLVFTVFSLLANGIFLSQVSIMLSNYTEDFFTPLEAERIVPTVESADTIGGILAGSLLASAAFSSLGSTLILVWIGCLGSFLLLLFLLKPKLPFFLQELEKNSPAPHSPSLGWNAISKSIEEIRRVPFLQILLTVLIFHGVIAQFIEFLYTKAVDESVHLSSVSDHEASLTHSLGILHVFLHGSALIIELFVSSRLLRSLGTFAGFLLHVVMIFFSGLAMVFGYGYLTAVLARNNFEMTTIIQRNAYETSYYAFRYGTLRSLREFFEGIILPIAAVLGTILILGIENFFLEADLHAVIPFFLLSLALGMGVFAFQLQKHYTDMTIQNLYSRVPIAQHHAIEIISQRGHKNSFDHLLKIFYTTESFLIQEKIIRSFGSLGGEKVAVFLARMLRSERDDLYTDVLLSCKDLGRMLNRSASGKRIRLLLRKALIHFLKRSELEPSVKAEALATLSYFDPDALVPYLSSDEWILQAVAAVDLWKSNLHKEEVDVVLRQWEIKSDEDSLFGLLYFVGHVPSKRFLQFFESLRHSTNEVEQLVGNFGLFQSGERRRLVDLVNLLLSGNEVIFKKGLALMEQMPSHFKNKIIYALHEEREGDESEYYRERLAALPSVS